MEQISSYLPLVYLILGVLGAFALIALTRVFIQLRKTLVESQTLITGLDETIEKTNVLIEDITNKSNRLEEPLEEMLVLIEQVTVTLQRVMGIFVKVSSVAQAVNKVTKKKGRGGKK